MPSSIKKHSKNKLVSAGGNSSSQPDLSKVVDIESDSEKVFTRKRKTPEYDFTQHFSEFKYEILNILKESSKNQAENINIISENISSINEKLQDVKTTTEQLVEDNISFKSQILTLKEIVKANENKILSLETEMQQLKINTTNDVTVYSKATPEQSSNTQPTLKNTDYDDIIVEFQERAERSKNIVIVGINEHHVDNIEERKEIDRCEADKIIKSIYPDCPRPEKIIRLGKYDGKKRRPLKICFPTQETAKTVLRNKVNLKVDGIRIYSDQTPKQQKDMKHLVTELHQRQENGEKNLMIKFIRGIPKIIKQETKN